MAHWHHCHTKRNLSLVLGAATLLLISACGEQSKQVTTSNTATVAKSSAPPAKALFGMKYKDTATGRVYIYDGANWVPYDNTVDDYYKALAKKSVALVQDEVCADGDPSCTPTGAHGTHGSYDCRVCHKYGGRLTFDKAGPAYRSGWAAPTFDATAKTCTNISCHGVPSGTFSYYFPDGTGEPALNTVTYGSTATTAGATTPSWYGTASDGACSSCHDNPPRNGSSGSNVWHSGYHGGQGPTGAYNQCQFCHPDATGANGQGTSITNPALHANGVVNVQATFKTACFGCH